VDAFRTPPVGGRKFGYPLGMTTPEDDHEPKNSGRSEENTPDDETDVPRDEQ